MPRFYFHVQDGASLPDLDGTELPDLQTARLVAARLAARLLADAPRNFWNVGEWRILVTGQRAEPLFSLRLVAQRDLVGDHAARQT